MSAAVESLAVINLPQREYKSHLVRLVESARKAKSPIVGIPIPGERPLCIKRELLRESLRDMQITEASIQRPLPGSNQQPYLLVFAVTDNGIKGSRKYCALQHGWPGVQEPIRRWAESERKRLAVKPKSKGKAGRIEILIRKLEKEKSKLGSCERLAAYEPEPASEYERAAWDKWRKQKTQRKGLTRILARLESNVINERGMYFELDKLFADYTERYGEGMRAKRASQLNTHERAVASKRGSGMKGYLTTPFIFHLQDKPAYRYKHNEELERATERRNYLYELSNTMRRRKEIDLQVADLQAMLLLETTGGVQ